VSCSFGAQAKPPHGQEPPALPEPKTAVRVRSIIPTPTCAEGGAQRLDTRRSRALGSLEPPSLAYRSHRDTRQFRFPGPGQIPGSQSSDHRLLQQPRVSFYFILFYFLSFFNLVFLINLFIIIILLMG
jgi:hypothetical protein